MPTQQPGQPAAVNMPQTYADAIQAAQHLIARLSAHREAIVSHFDAYQKGAVQQVQVFDQLLSSLTWLTAHRADCVHNVQHFQEKVVEAVKLLDQVVGAEGEKLQHLFNMQNGRAAPPSQAPQGSPQEQAQAQQKPAPVPNTVEVTQPPEVQAQVAEVQEANGQRTIFDNGQPVMVIPPPMPGSVGNGGVVQ